jgi:hypothetical protein
MEVNQTRSTVYLGFSAPVPIFFLGSEFDPWGIADGKEVVGGCGLQTDKEVA